MNKDTEAFAKIYDLYIDKIYRFIYFKVKSSDDAQDITSDVFLKAWRYIIQNENEVRSINSFLYTLAKNTVTDFYRKKRQQEVPLEDSDNLVDESKTVLEELNISSDMESVKESLIKLKDEYREVIILKYIDELSIKEISKIINKKAGATRVLIHRALQTLKGLVQKEKI